MPNYIDGYVIPVQKKKLAAYFRLARKASKLFREHGALSYRECAGDDLAAKFGRPFPRGIKAKADETVVFSWIEFKSRAHRDRVNAAFMKDPRTAAMCNPDNMPFDCARMLVGGFKVIVAA